MGIHPMMFARGRCLIPGANDRLRTTRSLEKCVGRDSNPGPCQLSTGNRPTIRNVDAVYDAIESLEADGIVSEISGSERYRVYEAPEILGVVASP